MTLPRSLLRILAAVATTLLVGFASFAAPSIPASGEAFSGHVETGEVPREARTTLAYVRAHGEAPVGYVGGRRFGNYGRGGEQKLPQRDAQGRRIDYQEWDIHPKMPGRSRGAQRLVTGSDGRAWYTADHYATFTEVR